MPPPPPDPGATPTPSAGGLPAHPAARRVRHRPRVAFLARAVAAKIPEDNVTTIAGGLAFFALLSVFPFLIFLVALVSHLPLRPEVELLTQMASRVLPADVARVVGDHLRSLLDDPSASLLGAGLLGCLWAASRAMRGLMVALNLARGLREDRGWIRVRLVALALTLGAGLLTVTSLVLLSLGGLAATHAARLGWVGGIAATGVAMTRWPILLLILLLAVRCIFHFGPCRRGRWRWNTVGSTLAVLLWVLVSRGFGLYVERFGHFNVTYGSLGGIMVVVVYCYVSALALLLGGEVDAVLDGVLPWGLPPPEVATTTPPRIIAAPGHHDAGGASPSNSQQ